MGDTVAQMAAAMRAEAGHAYRSRHSSDGRAELREWVARLCSAARWCERRTDPGELWEAGLWWPVLLVELRRRRCSGCSRIRGRAAVAGGLCSGCELERRRTCADCGGKLRPYHGPGRYCVCGVAVAPPPRAADGRCELCGGAPGWLCSDCLPF